MQHVCKNTKHPAWQVYMKKVSLSVVLIMAFVIFIIDSVRPQSLQFVRKAVLITVTPVIEVLSKPVQVFNQWSNFLFSIEFVYSENQELKAENVALKKYKSDYQSLLQENRELRDLLQYNNRLEKSFIVSRVISDTGGIYARTLLLNSGSVDGVKDGLGIMTDKGLLGRTIHTNYNNTRVLLLTDINSEIPVVVNSVKEYGILAGNVSGGATLKFVRKGDKLKIGQTILTSGHGGVFPPGIEVGKIASIQNGRVTVDLSAKPNDTSYVRIVRFKYTSKIDKVTE